MFPFQRKVRFGATSGARKIMQALVARSVASMMRDAKFTESLCLSKSGKTVRRGGVLVFAKAKNR